MNPAIGICKKYRNWGHKNILKRKEVWPVVSQAQQNVEVHFGPHQSSTQTEGKEIPTMGSVYRDTHNPGWPFLSPVHLTLSKLSSIHMGQGLRLCFFVQFNQGLTEKNLLLKFPLINKLANDIIPEWDVITVSGFSSSLGSITSFNAQIWILHETSRSQPTMLSCQDCFPNSSSVFLKAKTKKHKAKQKRR